MKQFYVLVVWLCLLPVGLMAQTRITGTVLDENGGAVVCQFADSYTEYAVPVVNVETGT